MTRSNQSEIEMLERRYWQAMKDGDTQTALSLTDFPCTVAVAQGVAQVDEKAFVRMADDTLYEIKNFEFVSEFKYREHGPDAATIAYEIREDVVVEGQPVTLDASQTSLWVRRDGKWRCALHAESLRGDPFGRDRIDPEQRLTA